jgi:hypothetical protein
LTEGESDLANNFKGLNKDFIATSINGRLFLYKSVARVQWCCVSRLHGCAKIRDNGFFSEQRLPSISAFDAIVDREELLNLRFRVLVSP